MEVALDALNAEPLETTDKGFGGGSEPMGTIARHAWNVLRGDLPLPIMVLNHQKMVHNIDLVQAYCDGVGAWLAPHGKTTMAPQIFAEQIRRGAWAITVASVAQLRVCRHFGIARVLLANEVVAPYDIAYIANQLNEDPEFELYLLVDSAAGAKRLADGLRHGAATRSVNVLLELGFPGGRCGVRSESELLELCEVVLGLKPALDLAGVEGYEGIIAGANLAERIEKVDAYLGGLRHAFERVRERAGEGHRLIVSAGGSVYFDRVVAALGRTSLPEARLVIRPGGYVTHDSEFYDVTSPMGSRSDRLGAGVLKPALEVWATVLSRPEPCLAILGAGRRDFPTDVGLPIPLYRAAGEGAPQSLAAGWTVTATNDQHTYLKLPADERLEVGDLIGCGIQHPCAAFDRWRHVYMVDDSRTVTGAIRTFF